MAEALQDKQLRGILSTLGMNVVCAVLCLIAFYLVRKLCGKSVKEDTTRPTHSVSFFVQKEEEQGKMLLKDICLMHKSEKLIEEEVMFRRLSSIDADSVARDDPRRP